MSSVQIALAAEVERLRAELATRDAKPDCRTCEFLMHHPSGRVCLLKGIERRRSCINGDAYLPADPVRLYETGGE